MLTEEYPATRKRNPNMTASSSGSAAESLGRAIQLRRVELGMKRRELAMAASLSYPYVSEIENGQKEPSAKALRQLAEALELTPSDLVTLTDRLAAAGDSPSLLLDADQRPASRGLRSDTLGSGLGEGRPVVALATPTQPVGETPGDGLLERWMVETVTRVVRVELARWAAHELPEIVRAEVENAIDGRGKR